MKIVGKCGSCTKSQVHKDIEHHVAKVEEMGLQEDTILTDEKAVLETATPPAAVDEWCIGAACTGYSRCRRIS
jgi:hypothetical protein